MECLFYASKGGPNISYLDLRKGNTLDTKNSILSIFRLKISILAERFPCRCDHLEETTAWVFCLYETESFQAQALDCVLAQTSIFLPVSYSQTVALQSCFAGLPVICVFDSLNPGLNLEWRRPAIPLTCDVIVLMSISNIKNCQISVHVVFVSDRFEKLVWAPC